MPSHEPLNLPERTTPSKNFKTPFSSMYQEFLLSGITDVGPEPHQKFYCKISEQIWLPEVLELLAHPSTLGQ